VRLLKTLVATLQKRWGVLMYLDLHGHSARKNTFLFGPDYSLSHPEYLRSRLLARLIEKANPCFRFYSCSFNISQRKKATARAVMLHQLKVPYSYTVESSIGLYYQPQVMRTVPFSLGEWGRMGEDVGVGVGGTVCALRELEIIMALRRAQREALKKSSPQRSKKIFA
jgi:hypothetical protein